MNNGLLWGLLLGKAMKASPQDSLKAGLVLGMVGVGPVGILLTRSLLDPNTKAPPANVVRQPKLPASKSP